MTMCQCANWLRYIFRRHAEWYIGILVHWHIGTLAYWHIGTLAYCHISTLFLHYSNSKYGYFRLSRSIFNTICPKNLLCSSEPG